ncbi:MAG: hypothetical protein ACM3NO_01800 [Deltaproteobacteria bacterium]
MAKRISAQFVVGLGILLIGGGAVGGEYFLVKWYPGHKARVAEETLVLRPYHNDSLGLDMQVAEGIFGKVEPIPGGVKFSRFKFLSMGPSLTVTAQPNPDRSFEFSPFLLAKWQTLGVTEDLPRYNFQHTQINKRDAAFIWEQRDRIMWETAHIMSPDRIVEARCTPGREDETLYLKACDESLRSIQLAGEFPPEPKQEPIELIPHR